MNKLKIVIQSFTIVKVHISEASWQYFSLLKRVTVILVIMILYNYIITIMLLLIL